MLPAIINLSYTVCWSRVISGLLSGRLEAKILVASQREAIDRMEPVIQMFIQANMSNHIIRIIVQNQRAVVSAIEARILRRLDGIESTLQIRRFRVNARLTFGKEPRRERDGRELVLSALRPVKGMSVDIKLLILLTDDSAVNVAN